MLSLFASLLLCTSALVSAVDLSSSAILFAPDIWPSNPGETPKCVDYVDRIAAVNSSSVQFVISVYWQNANKSAIWSDHFQVKNYCYKLGDKGSCIPITSPEQIVDFQSQIQVCFQRAVERGLDFMITPHLEDGSQSGFWRNGLIFDPLEKFEGFSYQDILIAPIAKALKAVNPKSKISFSMQGLFLKCSL